MSDGLKVRRATPEEIRMLGGAEYVADVPAAAPQPVTVAPVTVAAPAAPVPVAPPPTAAAPAAVAAAQGVPAPRDDALGTVALTKPIQAMGRVVTEVTLRKPTVPDIRKAGGYPIRNRINPATREIDGIDIDPEAICKLIHLCSEPMLPPSSVDQLDVPDFFALQNLIVGFFG